MTAANVISACEVLAASFILTLGFLGALMLSWLARRLKALLTRQPPARPPAPPRPWDRRPPPPRRPAA